MANLSINVVEIVSLLQALGKKFGNVPKNLRLTATLNIKARVSMSLRKFGLVILFIAGIGVPVSGFSCGLFASFRIVRLAPGNPEITTPRTITFVRRRALPAPYTPKDIIPKIVMIMREAQDYLIDHSQLRLAERWLTAEEIAEASDRIFQIVYQSRPQAGRFLVRSAMPGGKGYLATVIELEETGGVDSIVTLFIESKEQFEIQSYTETGKRRAS